MGFKLFDNQNKVFKARKSEQSFSLFETVIAVGMLASILLNVNGIQGQAIYSVEYQENLSKASWLAKGLMAKVEYEWKTREFKEMEYSGQEQNLNELTWGRDTKKAYDGFTYRVLIEEWKLPIVKLLTSSLGGGDEAGGDGGEDFITSKIKEILGDEILKMASVEVFWPEGARRGSTQLSMVLTNEKSLDKFISTQKGILPETDKKKPGTTPPAAPGSIGGEGGNDE